MPSPRLEINLKKINENSTALSQLYNKRGIQIIPVSKAVLGNPRIVQAMIQADTRYIADSRLENIQRMKDGGIKSKFVLLRSCPGAAELTVKLADISLNTEIQTVRKLSRCAAKVNKIHQVILMVEMGDLREGIMPTDLFDFIDETLTMDHLELIGIGCNLACYGGVKPNKKKMHCFSELSTKIERQFKIQLQIVSAGNSANYDWFRQTQQIGKINNLRLGESILLGRETLKRKPIPNLHTDAFKLVAEVIESKRKPSIPDGEISQDAFGNLPVFKDRGDHQRLIVALGRQDVPPSSLNPQDRLELLGASSDHLIIDDKTESIDVGDEISFEINYGGLLAAMTSPYVYKHYIA
ncbi:MAG: alanine/ornithine racemase family PLP-dependent enzyme [Calditrichaeota bacterium]|nr:alanine/ornithine racemase family PLP-dependent enzyme [Calditrichota bacterium]